MPRKVTRAGPYAASMAGRMTAVDLFAGAGGATQGLRDAGFKVLAAIENDAVAAATYRRNHRRTRVYQADIRAIDPVQMSRELRIKPGELSLLQACPPCQTFSTLRMGRSKGPDDDLILQVARFARALKPAEDLGKFFFDFKPAAIVVENVPGLGSHRRFKSLLRQLRALDYGTRTYEVDAVDLGVAQRRKRLIMLAVRSLDGRTMPKSLLEALPLAFERSPTTVGEVLAIAAAAPRPDELDRHRQSRPLVARRIKAIPRGGSRFDLPSELRLNCHNRLTATAATGSYGRMRADEPAPTMTTRCTTPACGRFIHPTKDRGITLREAALIQGFPVTYAFAGGYDQIERQIGNAIPVRMALGVAQIVSRLLS